MKTVFSRKSALELREDGIFVILCPVVDCHRACRKSGMVHDRLSILVQIVGISGFFLCVHDPDAESVGDIIAFRSDEADAVFAQLFCIFGFDSGGHESGTGLSGEFCKTPVCLRLLEYNVICDGTETGIELFRRRSF